MPATTDTSTLARLTVEADLVIGDEIVDAALGAAMSRVAGPTVDVSGWRIVPCQDPRCRASSATLGSGPVQVIPLDIPGAAWDVTSTYLETFWLPVIGPTPVLALRRLAIPLHTFPSYQLEPADLAGELGVGQAALDRTLARLTSFGFIEITPGRMRVSTWVPWLSRRMTQRLPARLVEAHGRLAASQVPA